MVMMIIPALILVLRMVIPQTGAERKRHTGDLIGETRTRRRRERLAEQELGHERRSSVPMMKLPPMRLMMIRM